MAKLKAPLMSLGASGQLGKALVFFGWKGLDVVREYVIPANPDTALQQTQRAYVTACVTDIHAAQAHATDPMLPADVAAYALLASTIKAAMTWFNMVVKQWLLQNVAGLTGTCYRDGSVTPGANTLLLQLKSDEIAGGEITAGTVHWGTSRTALINSMAATIIIAANQAGATIPGLTSGQKYYIQFRPTAGAPYVGSNSGIYYGYPT